MEIVYDFVLPVVEDFVALVVVEICVADPEDFFFADGVDGFVDGDNPLGVGGGAGAGEF